MFSYSLRIAFLPYVARIEEGGGINYSKFITQFQIATIDNDVGISLRTFQNVSLPSSPLSPQSFLPLLQEILAAVSEKLLAQFSSLEAAFKELDVDGTTFLNVSYIVSFSDFRACR